MQRQESTHLCSVTTPSCCENLGSNNYRGTSMYMHLESQSLFAKRAEHCRTVAQGLIAFRPMTPSISAKKPVVLAVQCDHLRFWWERTFHKRRLWQTLGSSGDTLWVLVFSVGNPVKTLKFKKSWEKLQIFIFQQVDLFSILFAHLNLCYHHISPWGSSDAQTLFVHSHNPSLIPGNPLVKGAGPNAPLFMQKNVCIHSFRGFVI